jgi:winged helix-turn helix protein
MTVITMSRTEIDRMSVLHDLADGRIRIAEASTLMGLGRRQVFRLAKAYGKHGPQALVSHGAAGRATAAIRQLCVPK